MALLAALAVSGCSNTAIEPEPPDAIGAFATAASAPTGAAAPVAPASGRRVAAAAPDLLRPHSRWVAAAWADLPGWPTDRFTEFWPALMRSCDKPAPAWTAACGEARSLGRQAEMLPDATALRQWLQARFTPYRVESLEGDAQGLATGYFEPLIEASRTPRPGFDTPLYAPPADLATRRPYWTRQQIDSLPQARPSLAGREIAWLGDPLDALVLQIQGSGRLAFHERDGSRTVVRVAFAGHNDQPYYSVGRWLVLRGELKLEQASWPGIRQWARRNPKRVADMLWSNPRFVFFREEPLPDPAVGPKGAQGVPLTPGRSIAVDPASIPYGTPVWIDTTEPLSATPLRRLVVAQDTGSAIVGAVRADYFWGWEAGAEAQAGRMKQPLRLWALWPR